MLSEPWPADVLVAIALGPFSAGVVAAVAGAGLWPWRAAVGAVSLAGALVVATWTHGDPFGSFWPLVLGVIALSSVVWLALVRAAGWRHCSERRLIEEGARLTPERPDRLSLREALLLMTAAAPLMASVAYASRQGLWIEGIQGASFAAPLAVSVASAGLIGLAVWLVPPSAGRVGAVLMLVCAAVAACLLLESVGTGYLVVEETQGHRVGARELFEAMTRKWWRWTAALLASVAASMSCRALSGRRWRRWPYD